VNRSIKVFISSGVLAAGYGLACLTGPPDPSAGRLGRESVGNGSPDERTQARAAAEYGAQLTRFSAGVRLTPDRERIGLPTRILGPDQPEGQSGAPIAAPAPPADSLTLAQGESHSDETRPAPRARLLDTPKSLSWIPDSASPRSAVPPLPLAEPPLPPELPAPRAAEATRADVPASFETPAVDARFFAKEIATESRRPDSSPPRTHLIVDGDSLRRLAERYLKDANRSNEIYELNRDALSSPDLLPIGKELKIPARGAAPE
jgi:hypothetical protein